MQIKSSHGLQITGTIILVMLAALVTALCLLAAARFADPRPHLKAAFASGALVRDEAAHPGYAQLGQVRPDCELAGDMMAPPPRFERYLLAPQMPFDRDRILGTCQLSRDLAYQGPNSKMDLRPTGANPVGLRAWLRLSLAISPMQVWQILVPLLAIAAGSGGIYMLWRRKMATPVAIGMLAMTSLLSAIFAAMSLSLGLPSLLWPLAVAAALLPKTLTRTSLATMGATIATGGVLFDYGSGLGLTALICYIFGLSTRELSVRDFITGPIAYVGSATALILILALANVTVRGSDPIDGLRYISGQFSDLAVVISSEGAAITRAGSRVWNWVDSTNGGFALAAYGLVALVVFGGWAAHLRAGRGIGVATLVSAALAFGWGLLNIDRVTDDPMQFLSVPLLVVSLALLSVLVAARPAVALTLEPAS